MNKAAAMFTPLEDAEIDTDSADVTINVPPVTSSNDSSPRRRSPEIGFRPESLTFTAVAGEGDPEAQMFEVFTTRNNSILRFEVDTNVPWLLIDPDDGVSDSDDDRERITVSVQTSALEAGTYDGLITISDDDASNDPRTVSVTLVLSSAPVTISQPFVVTTPDSQIQVTVPEGALPDDVGGVVEVEITSVDVNAVPAATGDVAIVRAIELNTLVDGEVTPIDYLEPVELVFILTEADLALANGDTSRLVVLWFNTGTGAWEPIDVTYDTDPAPAGSLVALLDHFSIYALGITAEPEPEEPQVTEATATPVPTPTPVPEPEATSVPTAVPTVSVPAATPTAVVVAQAAPTAAPPQPTATAVPPAPAIPAAPAPPSQPPVEPPEPPPLAEVPGGIGTTT
ncbi:MAG: hypothetical protein IID57_00005, partial [Proteobacteria bacterium]|nr:hypothetical protein [Pseudomonadota bacterium]